MLPPACVACRSHVYRPPGQNCSGPSAKGHRDSRFWPRERISQEGGSGCRSRPNSALQHGPLIPQLHRDVCPGTLGLTLACQMSEQILSPRCLLRSSWPPGSSTSLVPGLFVRRCEPTDRTESFRLSPPPSSQPKAGAGAPRREPKPRLRQLEVARRGHEARSVGHNVSIPPSLSLPPATGPSLMRAALTGDFLAQSCPSPTKPPPALPVHLLT